MDSSDGSVVKVYIGQTRSRALVRRLSDLGYREITQRHELPPRRKPWALDNGAFGDWRAGRPFDAEQFRAALTATQSCTRPDWVAVPDRVAAGRDSLSLSLQWVDECARYAAPYLVVQDGMSEADVLAAIEPFAGLFVGGTLQWKLATSASWVRLAHEHGRQLHIGRVGTPKRVAWARRIGADSIDSCLPLWSAAKLDAFIAAVEGKQQELWRMDDGN